jgi:long-chain acyl-CoA synthetase
MGDYLRQLDEAVSALTADGAPFALERVSVDGVAYRSYASLPPNMGAFFQLMRQSRGQGVSRLPRGALHLWRGPGSGGGVRHQPGPGLRRAQGRPRGDPLAQQPAVDDGLYRRAVDRRRCRTDERLVDHRGARLRPARLRSAGGRRRPTARRAPAVAAGSPGSVFIAIDDCAGLAMCLRSPSPSCAVSIRCVAMPEVDVAPTTTPRSCTPPDPRASQGSAVLAPRDHLGAVQLDAAGSRGQASGAGRGAGTLSAGGSADDTAVSLHGSHTAFLLSLIVGRKLVIMHKWDAQEALRLIEAERITWFTGVPTMSAELQAAAAESDRDLSSHWPRSIGGGAARPPAQVEKLATTFKKSTSGHRLRADGDQRPGHGEQRRDLPRASG